MKAEEFKRKIEGGRPPVATLDPRMLDPRDPRMLDPRGGPERQAARMAPMPSGIDPSWALTPPPKAPSIELPGLPGWLDNIFGTSYGQDYPELQRAQQDLAFAQEAPAAIEAVVRPAGTTVVGILEAMGGAELPAESYMNIASLDPAIREEQLRVVREEDISGKQLRNAVEIFKGTWDATPGDFIAKSNAATTATQDSYDLGPGIFVAM